MLGKNNVWRFRVLGGDGKSVETGEGSNTITVRGPASKPELIRSAEILLNSKRADAIRAGLDDPGYRIDEGSIEPLGHTDTEVGFWSPAGGKPLSLPTDPAVREDQRKFLADKLGANDNA
jgi:hypothetical protein